MRNYKRNEEDGRCEDIDKREKIGTAKWIKITLGLAKLGRKCIGLFFVDEHWSVFGIWTPKFCYVVL